MKRIAVLTGGGDAPGLNAVIRAVTKTAINVYGCEVFGVLDGYDGFIAEGGVIPLDLAAVRGILPRGGTILGTANRGNPFARKVIKDGKEVVVDVSDEIIAAIKNLKMDAVIVIGGDGTLRIAMELCERGVPVIGVPKTIDNDVGGTEVTFGFDTALMIATEALDRLHTTAEAHHRVMVLELMGREAGFIALHSGVSGGADVILIPEIPFKFESVVKKVRERVRARLEIQPAGSIGRGQTAGRAGSLFPQRRCGLRADGWAGLGKRWAIYRRSGLRDARHRAGACPTRRHTDRLRPLAGDALRRGRCAHGRSGSVLGIWWLCTTQK